MRQSILTLTLLLFAATSFAMPSFAQEKEKPAADSKATKDAKAPKTTVDFEKQIWPILEKSCIECHATAHAGADGRMKKPKGGVVLDNKDGITTGKKGKLIVAKKPDESLVFASISLPADDEDRMPPQKKGAPLAKEQQDLIKQWINEGAEFGAWTGKKAEPKPEEKPAEKPAEKPTGGTKPADKGGKPPEKPAEQPKAKVDPRLQLQKGLAPVPAATLATFAAGPFHVASIGDDSLLLRVGCAGRTDEVDDQAVAALAPLAQHIAELDLARSRITDAACTTLATMPKLVQLDLRQTAVSDAGAAKLAACKELRDVNLFGTKIGDYTMAAFERLPHLANLYVWQTEASAKAVMRLREQVPTARIVIAAELPEPMAEGAVGGRRRGK